MAEHYEIGKTYLVPTVRYPWFGRLADWPVFGPMHDDAEIFNFPWRHYHVDHRFLSDRQVAFLDRQARGSGRGLSRAFAAPLMTIGVPHPVPVTRRLRCRRQWDAYPHGNQQAVQTLREAFAGRALVTKHDDVICPHRGVSLATIPPDADGIITCPLHGLRWCSKTGHAVHNEFPKVSA